MIDPSGSFSSVSQPRHPKSAVAAYATRLWHMSFLVPQLDSKIGTMSVSNTGIATAPPVAPDPGDPPVAPLPPLPPEPGPEPVKEPSSSLAHAISTVPATSKDDAQRKQ